MEGSITFLTVKRQAPTYRPVGERVKDFRDVSTLRAGAQSQAQASRCLDCGLPFCHWMCPIGNYVPTWNQLMASGRWQEAFQALQATNNIPEVTGRLCPATCEYACVLGIQNGDAVTVRENELAVIEHAFQSGFVQPQPPLKRTGKSVAIVGSGPAGLCCADQLNKAGHAVVVFERDDKLGGLLRYGIPDFKLEKWVVDRRLAIWSAEGIEFITGVHVGAEYPASKFVSGFDAVCLTGGSRAPRELAIEGRSLRGIHLAMAYLVQSNRRVAGERIPEDQLIDANGKRVVVIGGGDTGADCVGTAHRQGAREVIQIELLPRPPERRRPDQRWPDYPTVLRTSTSHEEGGVREWSVLTKQFLGSNGHVTGLSCVRVEWVPQGTTGSPMMRELPGTEFAIGADLVILALGFVSAERHGLLEQLGVLLDQRGNPATDPHDMTSVSGVFAAGDIRRGQSLIAWAVSEGRTAAHHIDRYLMPRSDLPAM